jgi:hypothetical protein
MREDILTSKLEKLYLVRDAKFDEIVSCLSRELYSDTSSLSDAERNHLVEAAEILTDNGPQRRTTTAPPS